MESKQRSKKGLTDKELAAKYEAGKIELGKILKPVLNKTQPKTSNQNN